MRRILAAVITVLAIAGLLAACGDDDDSTAASDATTTTAGDTETTEPNTVAVTAMNIAFSPTTANAKAGEVYFEVKNEDSTKHTFTIDGTDVDIRLDGGTSGEKETDLDAGTYEWHCSIHSSMKGTLTVS